MVGEGGGSYSCDGLRSCVENSLKGCGGGEREGPPDLMHHPAMQGCQGREAKVDEESGDRLVQ